MSQLSGCEDLMERGEVSKNEHEKDLAISESRGSSNLTTSATLCPSNQEPGASVEDSSTTNRRRWLQRFTQPLRQLPNALKPARDIGIEPREAITRTLENCPEGYPRLAALLDSDENFMIYRRFGYLQARILLNKQDELRELEKDLDRMDAQDAKTRPLVLQSREDDEYYEGKRKAHLREIEMKLKEYTQLLITARDLATFNPPPVSVGK